MRKSSLYLSVLAAALTLSTSITALAGEWQQDDNGWYYVQDNGSRIYARPFTDPADGSEYYMDPDGYMMTETRINGFWYGADGRRRDKTEAEIAAEQAREARVASRPSPAKAQAAAKQAAQAAKTSNIAVSTTRLAYQAEMKALMDKIFLETRSKVLSMDNLAGDATEDNYEASYRFLRTDRGTIISCALWMMANPENPHYKPEALELNYNRDANGNDEETTIFNETFNRLLTASLGENKGKAIYERCLAEEIGSGSQFEENDVSDTGNPYELTYRNNTVTLKVTCSEIVPETPEEAAAKAAQESEAAQETTAEETAPQQQTSSVIVAGQGGSQTQSAADTGSEAETEASAETAETGSEAETEASAETAETGSEAETEASANADGTEAASETEASTEADAQ